jgi:sporulation protein YlmC with PRC-barrel domain
VDYGNPTSYLALDPGTDVISSDGERVGKVEHVLADADSDIFDGLVIDVESGPGGLHFVDSEQVGELYERGCVLKVPAAEVASLPKPTPSPAVMEHHGVEDSESSLEAKLHRAWARITGNY